MNDDDILDDLVLLDDDEKLSQEEKENSDASVGFFGLVLAGLFIFAKILPIILIGVIIFIIYCCTY